MGTMLVEDKVSVNSPLSTPMVPIFDCSDGFTALRNADPFMFDQFNQSTPTIMPPFDLNSTF